MIGVTRGRRSISRAHPIKIGKATTVCLEMDWSGSVWMGKLVANARAYQRLAGVHAYWWALARVVGRE